MPVIIDTIRCDGCHGRAQPSCVRICPNDILTMDGPMAVSQEPDACRECLSCLTACPRGAISVLPGGGRRALVAGASMPTRRPSLWSVAFRNGKRLQFCVAARTTPEGSIDPYAGRPEPDDLESPLLFTETALKQPVDPIQKKTRVQGEGVILLVIDNCGREAGGG